MKNIFLTLVTVFVSSQAFAVPSVDRCLVTEKRGHQSEEYIISVEPRGVNADVEVKAKLFTEIHIYVDRYNKGSLNPIWDGKEVLYDINLADVSTPAAENYGEQIIASGSGEDSLTVYGRVNQKNNSVNVKCPAPLESK